jgi:hypothetical protein
MKSLRCDHLAVGGDFETKNLAQKRQPTGGNDQKMQIFVPHVEVTGSRDGLVSVNCYGGPEPQKFSGHGRLNEIYNLYNAVLSVDAAKNIWLYRYSQIGEGKRPIRV